MQPVNTDIPHLQGQLTLQVGQHSVAGRKSNNEDAIGIRVPSGNLLTIKGAAAVIADGVSAAEGGREASHTCVSNFLADYFSTPESWSVKHSAQQVLTALNRWLYSQGQCFPDNQRGFITTFSALVLKSQTAHLLHVGDSRIYRLRNGDLEQLTNDHSTPVARGHSYLARAMGLDVRLDVDFLTCDLQVGDTFLLTTDGVHDVLSPHTMQHTLVQTPDCQQASDELGALALEAGSEDNISCQILRIQSLPGPEINEVIDSLTQLRFPPFLDAGMILDGYRVLRELHASTRSQVYQVENVETGELFCMKTPSVNFEDDPAYIERFILESWIGSRISSPYVVKVKDSPRAKTCLYYLTEYISGMSLAQWMRENPKPAVEEAVFLIDQIAKGLRAMHRRETLHQDLKPDNVLVDARGRAKIIDFGSCHVAGIAEITSPIQRDIPLGTATYSAPEHVLLGEPDYRSDLFSLAVISFEMLTGSMPFSGRLEHCRSQRDFLATTYTESYKLNPLVPQWIDGALKKSLRFQPERRHADVSEFVYELRHPNPSYLEYHARPLMQRDPLKAWKFIAGVLTLTQLGCLILLLG